jgi:hypothetical protein
MIRFKGKELTKEDLSGLGLRPDEIELSWNFYQANQIDLEISSVFELHTLFKEFYRKAIGLSLDMHALEKIHRIVSIYVNNPKLEKTILDFAKVKLPLNPTEEDMNAFVQDFLLPILRGIDDETDDYD